MLRKEIGIVKKKKSSGRRFFIALLLFLLLIPSVGFGKDLIIAGSQATGTWFVFCGAVCQMITKYMPGHRCSPTPSSGSAENIRNIDSGVIDMALSLPDVLYEAYTGTGMFKDKQVKDIRAMFNSYSFPLHIITLTKSGLKSIAELKGKKVAIGPPGSTDHKAFELLLPYYDMTMKDMQIRPLSLPDRVSALSDGQVDAIVVLTGITSSAVTELMTTKDARYIQIPSATLKKFNEKYPYYVEGTIPKGTYKNLREDVTTVFTWGVLCASAKTDSKFIYDVTKLVFEKKEEIVQIINLAKELNPKDAVKVPIPLHPGAEKYFREIGALR
jgi:TRAP transporter TAXI family solute receptor